MNNAIFVHNTPRLNTNRIFPYPGVHKTIFGQYVCNFKYYHPMRAGCIPYTFKDGHYYFFLSVGAENEVGDFGGGISSKESTVSGALRECVEESAGIFGFHWDDVQKTGFMLYSEEIAVLFLPVDPSYISTIKHQFIVNSIFYNEKKERLDARIQSGPMMSVDELIQSRYELEILKAMTEKSAIEVVMDKTLFGALQMPCPTVGDRRVYYLIASLLKRSEDLLFRNLKRLYIPTIVFSYAHILQTSKAVLSERKIQYIESV